MLALGNKKVALFCMGLILLLLGLLTVTGCMCDTPNEDTPMPWSPATERDGMMPLPSSMYNRYN